MTAMTRDYRTGKGTCQNCGGPCYKGARLCSTCPRTGSYKVCSDCKQAYPRTTFQTANGTRLSYCPECFAARGRDSKYRNRYGVSTAEVEVMLAAQNYVCAICHGTNGDQPLYLDHCHATGRVRGMLCQRCNSGIGIFEDDPDLLIWASSYLRESQMGDQLP